MVALAGFDWSQTKPLKPLSPAQAAMAEPLAALTRWLEQTQWLSTAELESSQYRQLAVTAKHFAARLPAFRARLEDAGLRPEDLNNPEALRRLPILKRGALLEPGGVPDADLPDGHAPSEILGTSGSTGQPVVVRRTRLNALFWQAITMREMFWHSTSFAQRFTSIRATNAAQVVAPDWGAPVSALFATGPAQLIPITADIAQQVEWIRQFQPGILLVYPNVLAAIEHLCRRDGITLPGMTQIRTIGETLSPRVRAAAEQTFQCRVIDNYSSQEVGVIAVQCPDSAAYHVMDEALIVEVIGEDGHACEPGEIGRAVITDLYNSATPLFRYEIGDYVERGPPCPCGRGLHTLTRIVGRERNLILMPDGTRHWPLVGFSRFREIAPVMQYQFIQEQRAEIEVRLVTERPLQPSEEAALCDLIQQVLGYPIRLHYFDGALPRAPGGKFDEFVCRVQS